MSLPNAGPHDEARRLGIQTAISHAPWNWAAWAELRTAVRDLGSALATYDQLPRHPLKAVWFGLVLADRREFQFAARILGRAAEALPRFGYFQTQLGAVHRDGLENTRARTAFARALEIDPCDLGAMEAYSHLLYVQQEHAALSALAAGATKLGTARPETCCIVANYHSLVGAHDRAAAGFERAIKLDPRHPSAWTLLGHERIELRNPAGALAAYHRAVAADPGDAKAWYALGQAYELLRMPLHSLYYFERAAEARPNDDRMWIALGAAYEGIQARGRAQAAYQRAKRGLPSIDEAAMGM